MGSEGYGSWKEVSGYFDGDGNVGLEVVRFVLRLKIRFVDTWKPQVEAIKSFLEKEGIRIGSIGRDEKEKGWHDAYRLDINEIQSVLKAAKAMVEFTVKKKEDLRILIEYLEDRMTGNEALEAFNAEVNSGRRRGKVHEENLPYIRSEGLRLAQLENAKNARAAYAVDVPPETKEKIRSDHRDLKLGHILLGRRYGYSESVIRRVLRGD